jgi:hypothetical protein
MSSVLPYPGFLFAATICELSNSDVSELNEGCLAYVEATNTYYRLSDTPIPPAPDGVNVVSVPGGPATPGCTGGAGPTTDTRRWVLTNIADAVPTTAGSLVWYVDSVNGLDTNLGTTPLLPVQTVREVGRRWAAGVGYNAAQVSVYLMQSPPAAPALLPDDAFIIERPVTPGRPIVFLAARGPSTPGAAITAVQNIDQLGNLITQITTAAFNFVPYLGRFVRLTSGANLDYVAEVVEAFATSANLTPFTLIDPATLDTLDVATSTNNPVAPGTTFEILAPGYLVPSTVSMNIDPAAEVRVGDVTFDNASAPVPYVSPRLTSGNLTLVRSNANGSWIPFMVAPSAAMTFSVSDSNGFLIRSLGSVIFSQSTAALGANSSIADLSIQGDSVVTDNWAFVTVASQIVRLQNVCINNSVVTKIVVNDGSLYVKDALYGLNNADYVLSLGSYARGYYDCGGADQLLGMTIEGVGAGVPANMDFQNGPLNVKTMRTADLPFVALATALDSQAGFIRYRRG